MRPGPCKLRPILSLQTRPIKASTLERDTRGEGVSKKKKKEPRRGCLVTWCNCRCSPKHSVIGQLADVPGHRYHLRLHLLDAAQVVLLGFLTWLVAGLLGVCLFSSLVAAWETGSRKLMRSPALPYRGSASAVLVYLFSPRKLAPISMHHLGCTRIA